VNILNKRLIPAWHTAHTHKTSHNTDHVRLENTAKP